MIEELLNNYRKQPEPSVITRWAMEMKFKEGKMLLYSEWREADGTELEDTLYSPLGVAGVLYPPHVFTEEIFNKSVYRQLCRTADDIWFSIQEYINHIPVFYIRDTTWRNNVSVDHYSEYVEEASDALHFQNVDQGLNDKQLASLIEYYHINE